MLISLHWQLFTFNVKYIGAEVFSHDQLFSADAKWKKEKERN